ncbi:unnamed protein product, partial [Durusdinium trenchii]
GKKRLMRSKVMMKQSRLRRWSNGVCRRRRTLSSVERPRRRPRNRLARLRKRRRRRSEAEAEADHPRSRIWKRLCGRK